MKTAMILAAGRGSRLRPLTDSIPKALCPVNNKPLIEYHLTNLENAGFEKIVINHAYLGEQICDYVINNPKPRLKVCFSPEPHGGLETGGGIYNALPLLGDEPFLVVNADIFTDYDFSQLDIEDTKMASLVLVKNPPYKPYGDFGLNTQQELILENKHYTFAGIAYYRPEVFQHCIPGKYSVTPILHKLVAEQKISGSCYIGSWMDIGTMDRLALANHM